MADRYLIENREAAVGVQMFHMRQRWGAAVWRAQTQVLLGRLKCALFTSAGVAGWEEQAESRRAADTAAEASCRSHASGLGDGAGDGRGDGTEVGTDVVGDLDGDGYGAWVGSGTGGGVIERTWNVSA